MVTCAFSAEVLQGSKLGVLLFQAPHNHINMLREQVYLPPF